VISRRIKLVALAAVMLSAVTVSPALGYGVGGGTIGGFNAAGADPSAWPGESSAPYPAAHWPLSTQYVRLWDSGVAWPDIENESACPAGVTISQTLNVNPPDCAWHWSTLDADVQAAAAKGLGVVIVLGMTPRWAAPNRSCTVNYTGGCSVAPVSMWNWNFYVSTMAMRYASYSNIVYETWNEANLTAISGQPTGYYTGTAAMLSSLHHNAFGDIRLHAPNALVITPSFTDAGITPTTGVSFQTFVNNNGIGTDTNRTADKLTLHSYQTNSSPRTTSAVNSMNQIETTRYNGTWTPTPLWISEMGCVSSATFTCTAANAQAFVNNAASMYNVEAAMWYPLIGSYPYFGYNQF
jgi:hypothetical protein